MFFSDVVVLIFVVQVIIFVRAIIDRYQHLRESILSKLFICLGEIQSAKVLRVALWIIGEYCEDADMLSEGLHTLKEHVGPLPFSSFQVCVFTLVF